MPRIANRFSGPCRHCGQDVDAGGGFAVKDRPNTAWEVEHEDGGCPPNPHNPDSAPTWSVGGGEGYGQQPYTVGSTLRDEWWTSTGGPGAEAVPGGRVEHESGGNQRVSGVVTVVTARSDYYSDEGMSFGVGDEQGHYYSAQVRAATADEAAPILAAEARRAARKELADRTKRLLGFGYARPEDAEYLPQGTPELASVRALPQVPLRRHDDTTLYADELYLDESGGWLWTVKHNGMDGDDFSINNLPGHIVLRHPLTDERRQLVADLRATFASLEEWTRARIPAEAAQVLIRAGAQLHEVTDTRVAVMIGSVEDANAFLARSQQEWSQAKWEWPKGRRWPASDAARLADAGISHERAEYLRSAGFNTVDEVLAAAPPQLPGTRGRYVLSNCKVGPQVQVTDDPEEARRHLERDPATWAHWEHVPDITAVHVSKHPTKWGWQLWSDNSLSVGYWCEPLNPAERTRPTSLTETAEKVISLLVSSKNQRISDRAVWHSLLQAVELHTEMIAEEGSEGSLSSGESITLVRHDITLTDGTVRTLWDVATGWWYHGEDADAGEDRWVTDDEAAARGYYQEHRPRRR